MTEPFRLVTFTVDGRPDAPLAGLVVRDRVVPAHVAVASLTGVDRPAYATTLGLLEDWAAAEPLLAQAADVLSARGPGATPWTSLGSVRLAAPILYPSAVYGSGANYTDHMHEMATVLGMPPVDPRADDGYPWHFVKVPRNCVVGPDATVAIPSYSTKLDWEIELAAIIGKRAKDVGVADALAYVAGYTIANDLSARDHVKRPKVPAGTPFAFDWVSQKSFDGSCPLGPAIVPSRFVRDPQSLAMTLSIDGERMQDSSSAQMVFSVAEQVAYLSSRTTLHPGDVILTGTPAGVGMARGRFLRPGNVMRLEIEGLGVLENTIA